MVLVGIITVLDIMLVVWSLIANVDLLM